MKYSVNYSQTFLHILLFTEANFARATLKKGSVLTNPTDHILNC